MKNMRQILRHLQREYGERRWKHWGKAIDILVETILSQNTSDVNSQAGFRQLRRRFKSWKQVADAPVEEVERHIRVSGLSRIKAPRIQNILRQIKAETGTYDLEFLKDWEPAKAFEYLMRYDGVGPKTAYCVLMFSFGMPVFPVDTHIHRIGIRLGLAGAKCSAESACETMTEMIEPRDRYAMHLLMIEHGRKVCRARGPRCEECALVHMCATGKERVTGPLKRTLRR